MAWFSTLFYGWVVMYCTINWIVSFMNYREKPSSVDW
jgi:hypothetical protein